VKVAIAGNTSVGDHTVVAKVSDGGSVSANLGVTRG
jgi:signal recognition particle receptor subunit beta